MNKIAIHPRLTGADKARVRRKRMMNLRGCIVEEKRLVALLSNPINRFFTEERSRHTIIVDPSCLRCTLITIRLHATDLVE